MARTGTTLHKHAINAAGKYSGNALDLCPSGAGFESQQGHQLSADFLGFLNPSNQMLGK